MICPEIWARCEPEIDIPALDRAWWISWRYGDQEGHLAAQTCLCEPLCRGAVRHEVLRQMFRQQMSAAMRRQHQLPDRDPHGR